LKGGANMEKEKTEKEKILKNEVEELNAPKLQIDGIEEFEDRLEMSKVSVKNLGKMCSIWLFGA
jgi:hypothetical protein